MNEQSEKPLRMTKDVVMPTALLGTIVIFSFLYGKQTERQEQTDRRFDEFRSETIAKNNKSDAEIRALELKQTETTTNFGAILTRLGSLEALLKERTIYATGRRPQE